MRVSGFWGLRAPGRLQVYVREGVGVWWNGKWCGWWVICIMHRYQLPLNQAPHSGNLSRNQQLRSEHFTATSTHVNFLKPPISILLLHMPFLHCTGLIAQELWFLRFYSTECFNESFKVGIPTVITEENTEDSILFSVSTVKWQDNDCQDAKKKKKKVIVCHNLIVKMYVCQCSFHIPFQ